MSKLLTKDSSLGGPPSKRTGLRRGVLRCDIIPYLLLSSSRVLIPLLQKNEYRDG